MTQQIHSLRESGVSDSQAESAALLEASALRISGGRVCTVPFAISSLAISLYVLPVVRRDRERIDVHSFEAPHVDHHLRERLTLGVGLRAAGRAEPVLNPLLPELVE